jgi:hypothetical protein
MSSDRRGLSNRSDALVGHAHGHDTVEKTGITYFGPETGRTRPYRLRGAVRRDSSTNAQNLLEDAVQQFQRAIDLNPNFSALTVPIQSFAYRCARSIRRADVVGRLI